MSTKVTPVTAATVDLAPQSRTAPPPQDAPAGRESKTNVAAQADLRLVIEQDSDTGSYVYRTIDRRTGEVVQQFPVEEVLKLRRDQDYAAGTVIKTTA